MVGTLGGSFPAGLTPLPRMGGLTPLPILLDPVVLLLATSPGLLAAMRAAASSAVLALPVLLFPHIAACINSDFDDDHDSPKGEVNPNVLINSNDVSDIFKQVVDDKGVSSCLKSLWKTTLCKLYLSL